MKEDRQILEERLRRFVAQVGEGEKLSIHVQEFAAFVVEVEFLRLSFCIKTSVVGGLILLERWDIASEAWNDFKGSPKGFITWLQ